MTSVIPRLLFSRTCLSLAVFCCSGITHAQTTQLTLNDYPIFDTNEAGQQVVSIDTKQGFVTFDLTRSLGAGQGLLKQAKRGSCLAVTTKDALFVPNRAATDHELLGVVACSAPHALAHTSYRFEDYPATVYTGPHQFKAVGEFKGMQGQLQSISRQKVSYAGEYVTGGWGCGSGCASTVLLNVRTGQARYLDSLDVNVTCTKGMKAGIQGRPDSRLIILTGAKLDGPNEGGPYACTQQHWVEVNGTLNALD